MQPDRRPEHRSRRTYPPAGRETRMADRSPEVPTVNKRKLGGLARRYTHGVDLRTNDQFVLRVTSAEQILTPIANIPIIATHQDGNGSINGGTSKEAIRRTKRKTKRG